MTMTFKGDQGEVPLDLDPLLPPELSPEDVDDLLHRAQQTYWYQRVSWERRGGTKPSEWIPTLKSRVVTSPIRGDLLVSTLYTVNIRSREIRSQQDPFSIAELES